MLTRLDHHTNLSLKMIRPESLTSQVPRVSELGPSVCFATWECRSHRNVEEELSCPGSSPSARTAKHSSLANLVHWGLLGVRAATSSWSSLEIEQPERQEARHSVDSRLGARTRQHRGYNRR
jgi:hypothetical protein